MCMRIRLTMASTLFFLAALASADDFPLDEPLAVDTPATTVAGNPFTASADWSISVRGTATILTPPEGGSHVVLVDVDADDQEIASPIPE